jgi:predicted RND superfamily exporter protein
MPSNELIIPNTTEIADPKTTELIDSVVLKANLDRDTAKEVYNFVKKEIDTMMNDYQFAKDCYDSAYNTIQQEENTQYKNIMMCKLGKPPRRPNIVAYVEQMNRALEMSIKSGENVVSLLNIISRANNKKVNVEEINIDNRAMLLEEIIEEKKMKADKND